MTATPVTRCPRFCIASQSTSEPLRRGFAGSKSGERRPFITSMLSKSQDQSSVPGSIPSATGSSIAGSDAPRSQSATQSIPHSPFTRLWFNCTTRAPRSRAAA